MTTQGLPHENDGDELVFVLEPEPEGWDDPAADSWATLPAPVPANPVSASTVPAAATPAPAAPVAPAPVSPITTAEAPGAHPWSDGIPAPMPHPSQHVPLLTPPVLGADISSHASIVHRGGVYELTLDGLRLSDEPNIVHAQNRLANEAIRRGVRIIASVKDLRSSYWRQFNVDGTSDVVAPPVPPEANLGIPVTGVVDLSHQSDGGASQEEWVADNILLDEAGDAAARVDTGFLASLRDRLRRA